MAADGSLSVQLELERFIERCPELKLIPCFYNLLKKGDKITEGEVVEAVAELVLHPKYTIPLLGCFRPIAQKIVERTVKLLALVSNLSSDDEKSNERLDEDVFFREDDSLRSAELVCVIEDYARKGKGLHLHEIACFAFCRALDLIPSLLGSILNYFEFAPAPFHRILQSESVSKALAKEPKPLLDVVRSTYCFLILETEVFRTLWDWSCIFDLVVLSRDGAPYDPSLEETILDLKWCGIRILSVVLRLSSRASKNLGLDPGEDFRSSLRWREFCMDLSLEKAGQYVESSLEQGDGVVGSDTNLDGDSLLQPCELINLASPSSLDTADLLSNKFGRMVTENPETSFILTSAMKKSFRMISLSVSQRWPVLLYGPAGSGKTAVINKLARSQGSRVLSIHMDEQIDGKTLIGSYVCTGKPGEFRWQPGSLSLAVRKGFWVIIEDIDKAPPDIFSILLPLLEGAVEFTTSHGDAVRVNNKFRLFATVTSSGSDTSHLVDVRHCIGSSWLKVMINAPSNLDLLDTVLFLFPELQSIAGKLIETFEIVNWMTRSLLGLTASAKCHDRFSLRDLLKLCKRIASMGISFGQGGRSSYACECICKESIDVFGFFSTSAINRLAIMREISKLWAASAVETLYPINKPIITESSVLQVGRVTLEYAENMFSRVKKPFVELRTSVCALERIASSVKFNEPVLLVGETGTGKTTLVQTLASRLGQKLTVLNLSQQSDIADLLGGFKPVDARFVCVPLYREFEHLFTNTVSLKDNEAFLSKLRRFLTDKNWNMLLKGFRNGVRQIAEIGRKRKRSSEDMLTAWGSFSNKLEGVHAQKIGSERKRSSEDMLKAWENFSAKLERAHAQVSASDGMVFSFVEGAFIHAMRNGEWILLDEVNLAPPEILERVAGVLEDEKGSLCLAERGDIDYVLRHPSFRIFACMNPATDAGKRDLPISVRGRFSEYYVDDVLSDEDLALFVSQFMEDDPSYRRIAGNIVGFYKAAKESEVKLQDGANQKPHYSLRSLYRALEYLKKARRHFGFERSLYDGFSMFFLNLLDDTSSKQMNSLICKHLLDAVSPQPLPFDSYLIKKVDDIFDGYVLTKSVRGHLRNLAQAIFIGKYPVLLQGPTSSGKTSLVSYLAALTGHEFVRINNHEHTDLQEYLGFYITDVSGKLVFQEGPLVKAVRNGHWVVLDELNLAPSDVLEALNRLLDDNRELFVPELGETVRCHPDFMLFATQNPPVVYGGRKLLSRAFRNRFVEIHVDDIPQEELITILAERCKIPESYARKMVDVMKELQLHRQSSKIFAGKHGFVTLRDLFRWAERFRKLGNKDFAYDGYYLMAERLRDDAEKRVVKDIFERQLRVKISGDDLYKQEAEGGDSAFQLNKHSDNFKSIGTIIWTKSLLRTYFLVERCYQMREPVLLVGETGGGKTTVCQLLSDILGSQLRILNCHQFTETSDFLGGFYPVRERSSISMKFQSLVDNLAHSKAFIHFPADAKISSDINQATLTLNMLSLVINSYRDGSVFHPEVPSNEVDYLEEIFLDLSQLQKNWQTIFMWQDGPLVKAMKDGDMFLVDEISLADDSVLERLNSVLEPERKLSLAEKGGPHLENIIAHQNFFLLATMNPGGDYGKKELSPALRNRFTEIWVPSVSDIDDLRSIALDRIPDAELSFLVDAMMNFWEWFNLLQAGKMLTVRDLLSWVSFINMMEGKLSSESAFIHGAFLVLLDGLILGTNISKGEAAKLREKCFSFLLQKLNAYKPSLDISSIERLESYGWGDLGCLPVISNADNMEFDHLFGIHPFYIEKGNDCTSAEGFEFLAPTTGRNALRLLRALQLNKPILLEGSPGVGKTSLITAMGKFSGHTVVRINLSEQTDIMDLLGSDLPVESDEGIHFAWSDGILLQALKNGSWVLLDELNLAPQSVLEGLNAILDHRAEVFIPELGRSFKCPTSFRVFACQNPACQGGGRKGLPRSFLNRFIKVYADELVDEDYVSICNSLFPSIERSLMLNLIEFNKRLHNETMFNHKFGQDGSPWEFNLRDVIRSCQIIQDAPERSKSSCFLSPIYLQRMRNSADRIEVLRLYEQTFGVKASLNPYPRVKINPDSLSVGNISVDRYYYQSYSATPNKLMILPGLRHCLETAAQCVKHQWLCILVGPPSSGKTSMIRLLAQLTGNALNELNLSSATDMSELLGCFEQYNASRHYRLVIAQVERYLNEYCNLLLELPSDAFTVAKDLTARWLALMSNLRGSASLIENHVMKASITHLVDIVECIKFYIGKLAWPLSWSVKDLENTLDRIRHLENDCQKSHDSVKFEWVTGPLIKAIENGEWIVLENANLCNPTVLDRINSLVEQSGSITVNECGTIEGNPVVLHPHPRFRMFLTVNPIFGEVSRAMRNRGVEIYMMRPYWLIDETDGQKHYDLELQEVKRFITLSGIPVKKIVDMMANAHMYAKHEGCRLNVSITYLELSRWVQLFQQLIIKGNKPSWSIVTSWELIYLSSFGKENGMHLISQAALSYLSSSELYRFTSYHDSLLSLPGGWPSPLKLKDYVFHSKEACVRHNVMYLESLGSQIAAHEVSIRKSYPDEGSTIIHILDAVLLRRLMFPSSSKSRTAVNGPQSELDLVLAMKKLCFAADWLIEQATEDDYLLYINWFEWFGARLKPFCSFFIWFSNLLKEELRHSIWTKIFRLRHELMSSSATGKDSLSIPILSQDLVDKQPCAGELDSGGALVNAIMCVGKLRRSFQQWSKEDSYDQQHKPFSSVLGALRRMEEKILNLLVEPPSFDVIFKLYSDLLEHHIFFWNSIISSEIQCQPIYGHSLMKDAMKLREICPEEAAMFQKSLGVCLNLNLSKALLWELGGRPCLPSSADVYQLQCQISTLCESLWPREIKFARPDNNGENEDTNNGAFLVDRELRGVAMHGLCMSSYIIAGAHGSESEIIKQLEEIYQGLVERVEFEKQNLKTKLLVESKAELPTDCCNFNHGILSKRFGFDCWLMTQPILDESSLALDLELLRDLTEIALVDNEKQNNSLQKLSARLESSLNFALHYSSRPLADILPHQMILWTTDAPESVSRANEKVSSYILQLWFRWHATLWKSCPMLSERLSEEDDYGIVFPNKLFWPLKLATVDHILQNVVPIKDCHLHGFKLRAASRNIWLCLPHNHNFHFILLCVVRCLFQQIIYAHKKTFENSKYAEIRSAFHSAMELRNPEMMKSMVSLLASSSHHALTSLIDAYIEPLLGELYSFSDDGTQSIGYALLHIGGLRYNLLVCSCNLDPSLKYSIKYSELTEKIASLELEIEVREECIYLAGTAYQTVGDNRRKTLLKKLNEERRRMQKKMVFRPNPGKLKELKHHCDEFLESVKVLVEWNKGVGSFGTELVARQTHNWQKIMSCFIDRLSNEYSEFSDITEPIQLAVYEMKLGLSLIVSGAMHKGNPENSKSDISLFLTSIYELMRFPRACTWKLTPLNVTKQHNISTPDTKLSTSVEEIGIETLRNIIRVAEIPFPTGVAISPPVTSALSFKVSIYHIILQRIKESAAVARFLGDCSLKLLHEIFDEVVCLCLKHRVKASEDKAEQFKFRARAFKMTSVIEIDVSNCAGLLGNDSFSEWKELLSEDQDEKTKVYEDVEAMKHVWDAAESDLDGIINIHNQLFGSVDLVQRPGGIKVSTMDRISSFLGSYMLGLKMTRELGSSFSSCFDAKLAPEHLFRLCLEHDDKFLLCRKSTYTDSLYKDSNPASMAKLVEPVANLKGNFYKDSNSAMMAKLVEPVANLRGRILTLPDKFDNHPAIHKLLEVIDMILALPLDSPLAKALSALEFLLNRVWIFAEFPVSEQLQPILALVSSWQKLELESWPALLDEVDSQFEKDTAKLWFPLYSVLLRSRATAADTSNSITIECLDEFFRTSSIGEFKRQLQLLLSFHGQITNDLNRRTKKSIFQEDNVKILYNTFGFYVQLLPRITKHIGENRKPIEREMNELLKLCRWDNMENRVGIENFKRHRVKLRKMVKNYSNLLQQPLMEFLGQAIPRGKSPCVQVQNLLVDPYEVSREHLYAISNQIHYKEKDSSVWFADWWKSLESMEGVMSDNGDIKSSKSPYLWYYKERELRLHTIQELCSSLIHCSEVWEDKTKKLVKNRAFSDLLKLLEHCGLSKHRTVSGGQLSKSQYWIFQPSYEVQHLLLTHDDHSLGNNDLSHLQSSSDDSLWRTANNYYFRSVASIGYLEKTCLNFHKDFSLVQVERSCSYVDHLIRIQQEQRATAYNLSEKLKLLRQCIWPFANLFSSSANSFQESNGGCFLLRNQLTIFNCLWQQKQIFDDLCTLLCEEHLLLQTVERNHLNSCSTVKGRAGKFCLFIRGILPDFQKSKNALDQHLLGCNEDVIMGRLTLHPYGVNKEMEQLLYQNFELMKTLGKNLSAFHIEEGELVAVESILLGYIENVLAQVRIAEELYYSSCSLSNTGFSGEDNIKKLEASFSDALGETFKHITGIFQSIGFPNYNFTCGEESEKNMRDLMVLFEKDISHLQVDLLRIVEDAGRLLACGGEQNAGLSSSICIQLKNVYVLLEKVLAFGDHLLQDFMVMHSMVSEVTYALANILSSLFIQGFGSAENIETDSEKEVTKDASGTGMGEGAGTNDVSDQINDEDQLLGTSGKLNEEHDASPDFPSKNEKGIEMEQDFDAEAGSVSEDSEEEEENEDTENEQLDSAMGEIGDNSNVVDEKVGNSGEDDDDHNIKEKYENGPSVKDRGSEEDELRAKEESAADKEVGENPDTRESGNRNDENGNEGNDGAEDMSIDKDEAFADPSGITPADQNQAPDGDTPMDEMPSNEPMEDGEAEDLTDAHTKNSEEKSDEIVQDAGLENYADDIETANSNEPEPDRMEAEDFQMEKHDFSQHSSNDYPAQSGGGPTQDDYDATEVGEVAPDELKTNNLENDFAPPGGKPNSSELETTVADSKAGERLSTDQSRSSLASSKHLDKKLQPNPLRSIGNALEVWKKQVNISGDLQEKKDILDDLVDDNADEYGYTADFDEGTDQALGPATGDQIRGDVSQSEIGEDNGDTSQKDTNEVNIKQMDPETLPIRTSGLGSLQDSTNQHEVGDVEKHSGESMEVDADQKQDNSGTLDSLVTVRRLSEDINELFESPVNDDALGKAHRFEPSNDIDDAATAVWRRYEELTTRLSQELVEQLRLVMEPTLASKLQGDYKTGKRINMKKVIPYIASHYRKDKIWLRRTRPSKRDYQVVIAVDDSRSMSEGKCGNFALEALVTVCRAMSQLEVGSLAVASFGHQGNIKLLHDFDQAFTSEAGVKMISSFTFKQENTIADEPVVDLMKYLNDMLDTAAMRARLPSGYNPLQQLVLVIADGRLNEKEKLKRYVRDMLSKKRMVAFLILDSPNDPILELKEVTVQGRDIKWSRYLDSFPFPYYLVLKDINALPRTLADLLRQWFELMQYSRE